MAFPAVLKFILAMANHLPANRAAAAACYFSGCQGPLSLRTGVLLLALLLSPGVSSQAEDTARRFATHSEAALIHARRADFPAARRHLQAALELRPDDALTWARLAGVKLQLRLHQQAVEDYEHALRIQPDWLELANEMAWLYATHEEADIRRPSRALALAESICAAEATNAAYLDTRAAALAALGRFEEAVRVMQQAENLLRSTSNEGTPAGKLREFDLRRRLYEQEIAYYEPGRQIVVPHSNSRATPELCDLVLRLAGFPRKPDIAAPVIADLAWQLATCASPARRDAMLADGLLAVILPGSQANLRTWEARAAAKAELGNFAAAIEAARRARRLAENESNALAVERINRQLLLYARELPYHESVDGLELADGVALAEFQAPDAAVLFQLARLLSAAGQQRLAIAAYRSVLAHHLDHRPTHIALADLVFHQGNVALARQHLLDALRLHRADAAVLAKLGQVSKQLGDDKAAVRFLSEALLHAPNWHDSANELAWLYATAFPEKTRRAIALAEFVNRATNYSRASYLDTLAAAYAAVGDFERARKHAGQAVSLLKNDSRVQPEQQQAFLLRQQLYDLNEPYRGEAAAQFVLGRHLARAGEWDGAAAKFSAALACQPNYAEALAGLAEIRLLQGKHEQALQHYFQAIQSRPEWHDLANHVAWILAAHPDDELRHPTHAVQLAEAVVAFDEETNASYLDTLAAAYAAIGRFEDAAEMIEQALERLPAVDQARRHAMLERQRLYEAGEAYRDATFQHVTARP